MAQARHWAEVRPAAGLARRYRDRGLWRDTTPAADLRHWARATPDAVAITAHVAGTGVVRMTFREYADQVGRMAAVLAGLGVGRGDVVAVQLPSWWQLNAVVLACARLGAVVAPVMTTIRARELGLMLSRIEPLAYVTTEEWDGYRHAAGLAAIADDLPSVKHRLIIGGQVGPGEIDLAERMRQLNPGAVGTDEGAEDPDRVSIVLFTSGTSGSPKAVLHSFNTFYAGCKTTADGRGLTPADVQFTPHSLAHGVGQIIGNMLPLYLGGEALIADRWNPDAAARLIADEGATALAGAPVFLEAIVAAAVSQGLRLPRLRQVIAGATTVPSSLIEAVRSGLGITLRGAWGMTEVTGATATSADEDPPDWAAHSIGRPHPALDIDLRSDGEISERHPARMLVRGACVCLATMGRDGAGVRIVADHDDGWYDTGDLAVADGRGGVRLVGRAADRIGGVFMIPAADVEDALRRHPDIVDAALVGYGPENELACAVVVSGEPLTLAAVREYLDGLKMTDWYQPRRLELVERLPRNASGKVDKHGLRAWLAAGDQG
jgi:cyclohexanecarboxylate-CoA ligase